MLTTQDIQDLKKIFVTKKEFNRRMDAVEFRFEVLEDDVEKFHRDFDEVKDILATLRSNLMGELQAMREEITTFGYRQARHTDLLESHAQRLGKLEVVSA